jgi:hypothetical protein
VLFIIICWFVRKEFLFLFFVTPPVQLCYVCFVLGWDDDDGVVSSANGIHSDDINTSKPNIQLNISDSLPAFEDYCIT